MTFNVRNLYIPCISDQGQIYTPNQVIVEFETEEMAKTFTTTFKGALSNLTGRCAILHSNSQVTVGKIVRLMDEFFKEQGRIQELLEHFSAHSQKSGELVIMPAIRGITEEIVGPQGLELKNVSDQYHEWARVQGTLGTPYLCHAYENAGASISSRDWATIANCDFANGALDELRSALGRETIDKALLSNVHHMFPRNWA